MPQQRLMGQHLSERGGVSLYGRILDAWFEDVDGCQEDNWRLAIEDSDGLTLRLHFGEDFSSDGFQAPGAFDINPVDIKTATVWAIPADVRREYGLDDSWCYNAEYVGDGEAVYDIVSPSQRRGILAD